MKVKNFKDKKLREEVWEKTGWGKVASWYDNTLSAAKSTQKDLILPELLKFLPLEQVKSKRLLDLGCGTGFFLKEYIKGVPSEALGVDVDTEILELAKENLRDELQNTILQRDGKPNTKLTLLKSDATKLEVIGDKTFDIIMSIEAIPNIKDLKSFAKEVSRVLDVGGKFIAVVNHPSFRVPQSSDWYFNKDIFKQGRLIYKYKTSHAIKIDMNPGTKTLKDKVYTYTFHRPFEEYMNTFTKSGLIFSFMKEICSNKTSQAGTRQKPEDEAREEIPMFLFLEFTKLL